MQSDAFLPPSLKETWGGFKNRNASKISYAKPGRLESGVQHKSRFKMKIRHHVNWRMLPPTTYYRHY